MIWPFTKTKPKKVEKNGTVDEEAENEAEAKRREVRRKAAEQRILKTIRQTNATQEATVSMEETHIADVLQRRKNCDTAARKAHDHASEVLGEETPA